MGKRNYLSRNYVAFKVSISNILSEIYGIYYLLNVSSVLEVYQRSGKEGKMYCDFYCHNKLLKNLEFNFFFIN